jgi:DNA-binding transcriptional MerR regulator
MENITTTISSQDRVLLRDRGIPIAHAIRMFCEQQRNQITNVAETNIRELRERNTKLSSKLDRLMKLLEDNLDENKFSEVLAKI